jgi:hypothetical protein
MVAWELQSRQTEAIVRCVIDQPESAVFRIQITHGVQEVMSQWYPSRREALDRADSIQQNLLRQGWASIGR